MNRLRIAVIIGICLFKFSALNAQKVEPLSVGDKVPDIVFNNVLNYKTAKAKLSDFRGKLVLLDFWATTCSSCIALFPHMSSLQQQFKDKIQILLVDPHKSYDTEDRIKKVIEKYSIRTGYKLDLPVPIFDTILNDYFPHNGIPHEVWIDSSGVVIGITESKQVTAANIQMLLDGKKLNMPVKNDFAFDKTKPLLAEEENIASDNLIYRSLLTGYKEGIGYSSGSRLNGYNKVIGFYQLNTPLVALLHTAYPYMSNLSNNRMVFKVNNTKQFVDYNDTSYTYCYDLTIPPIEPKDLPVILQKYLQEDLRRAFNVTVKKETRKLRSYVLITNKNITNLYTKYAKQDADLDAQSIKKYIHNWPLSEVIRYFDLRLDKPFIDETGITRNIDIDFPDNFDLLNSKSIIQFFRKSGFEIKEEMREVKVAVITDKDDKEN